MNQIFFLGTINCLQTLKSQIDQNQPQLEKIHGKTEDVKHNPQVKDSTHVTSLNKTADTNWNTLTDLYNTRY